MISTHHCRVFLSTSQYLYYLRWLWVGPSQWEGVDVVLLQCQKCHLGSGTARYTCMYRRHSTWRRGLSADDQTRTRWTHRYALIVRLHAPKRSSPLCHQTDREAIIKVETLTHDESRILFASVKLLLRAFYCCTMTDNKAYRVLMLSWSVRHSVIPTKKQTSSGVVLMGPGGGEGAGPPNIFRR